MLLPPKIAAGVADGTVTLAFRRWAAPRVKADSTFLSSAGLIGVRSVAPIDEAAITAADASAAGFASVAALAKVLRPRAAATRRPGDRRATASADDPVFRIELVWAGPDPRVALRSDDALTAADLDGIAAALARLDRPRAKVPGPWTSAVLRQIAAQPGRRAPDLAAEHDRETLDFKLDVRKLKALGLTISLPVGYELSPRGAAYLEWLDGAS
jgi:hypothetical protein